MSNANTQILDNITTRAIDLQRLTTRQRREARVFLDKLQADIVGQLAAIDPTGVGQTSARGKRLEKLLAEVKGTIRSAYRKEGTRLTNEIANLAEIEKTFAATSINKVIGVELVTASVTPAALNAIVDGVLIQGAPVSDWLSRQAGDTLQRFGDQMRLGIAEGETNSQLIRRVRGGMQNGSPVTGIMDISRRNADSLVRSATQAVSQKARQATYNENESLIKGEQWVSTIDLRTTLECSTRDGLVYTVGTHEPIDHSLPWLGGPGNLHWGCRSTSAPVLKTFRELGIDLDEVPPSTRASVNGQIAEDTTFEGWLSRRSVEEQNTNLGAGRAQLWRDGKIKFRDLVDGNGRELTLDQLRTKSAAAAVRKRKPRAKPKPKAPVTATGLDPSAGSIATQFLNQSRLLVGNKDLVKTESDAAQRFEVKLEEFNKNKNVENRDIAIAALEAKNEAIDNLNKSVEKLLKGPFDNGQKEVFVGGKQKIENKPKFKVAAEFIRNIVHPRLLPEVKVKTLGKGRRAYYKHSIRTAHLTTADAATIVAHEAIHNIEFMHPDILRKSVAFLKLRADGEKRVKFQGEAGYADKWVEKGSSQYAGKDYSRQRNPDTIDETLSVGGNRQTDATELLTVGIERLMTDAIRFAKDDPQYFDFVMRIFYDAD